MKIAYFITMTISIVASTFALQLPEVQNVAPNLQNFNAAWNSFLTQSLASYPGGSQEQCKPRKYDATGAYQGTILLLHGFTACPQQFDEVVSCSDPSPSLPALPPPDVDRPCNRFPSLQPQVTR